MGSALKGLLCELEACRGESAVCKLFACETPHTLILPLDLQTCHELKALADVFECEPAHLGFLILKSALGEIHEGLDDDLGRITLNALRHMESRCM